MMRRGEVHIGCSGWNYEHWRGRFYPEEAPPKRWFELYAEAFDTVEINNIFYQLPPRWRLNLERLESFLDLLPADLRSVFEFRDQSWMVDEVFQLLEERGVSFCAHDMPGLDVPRLAVW